MNDACFDKHYIYIYIHIVKPLPERMIVDRGAMTGNVVLFDRGSVVDLSICYGNNGCLSTVDTSPHWQKFERCRTSHNLNFTCLHHLWSCYFLLRSLLR